MNDLLQKLEAAMAETERIAREACHEGEGKWHQTDPDRETGRIEDERGYVVVFDEGSPSGWEAEHIVLNNPARVLRRVARDRRVLERHKPVEQWGGHITGKPWLVAVHCSHCREGGTEPGMYDDLAQPVLWPCYDVRDLAEDYEIEVEGALP